NENPSLPVRRHARQAPLAYPAREIVERDHILVVGGRGRGDAGTVDGQTSTLHARTFVAAPIAIKPACPSPGTRSIQPSPRAAARVSARIAGTYFQRRLIGSTSLFMKMQYPANPYVRHRSRRKPACAIACAVSRYRNGCSVSA